MKRKFQLLMALIVAGFLPATGQMICNPNGNLVIYSNYDGGALNINVDVNIPNLMIGVTTYEAIQINITGPYASNVAAVMYAGYNSNNDHCNTGHTNTTISGVPNSITTINIIPAATYLNPNGYPYIICCHNCMGTTGGCNTADQISHYFLSTLGGIFYSHLTQYGCYWPSDTYNVSIGGNCCAVAPSGMAPVAAFSSSATTICAGGCVSFTDQSSNSPTSWEWTFPGATSPTSTLQNPVNICYPIAGIYSVKLVVVNANGSDTLTKLNYITVNPNPPVPLISQNFNTLVSSAANGNQWYLNGNPINGATGQTYQFSQNGSYTLKVTNQYGCSSTSQPYVVSTAGVENQNPEIAIYPNPAADLLMVRTDFPSGFTLRLMRADGTLAKIYQLTNAAESIDLSYLAPGLYVAEINAGNMSYHRKILVIR